MSDKFTQKVIVTGKSWWKKVDHSRDILEVLDNHQPLATNNVMEEFDVEILR